MRRRTFVTSSVGLGTALLAGCSADGTGSGDGGDSSPDDSSDGETATDGDGSTTGAFRLLISDQPADIGDFDSLTVSFSHARVFRGTGDAETTEATDADETEATATTEVTEEPTETSEADEEADEEDDEDEDDEDDENGFTEFDLDGASVDLTEVVGDAAIPVLDGELPPGRYTKIELHASDVVGIVDGEAAEVKIPSGKLMLTKPFEVVAGESVDFVFDINVVKRGKGNSYNLLPVISQSGVAGKDVEVEEVEDEEEETDEDEASGEAETTTED
jgi:hypothetical protein